MSGKIRCVIAGAGIKGAALAAWLAMTGKCQVVLLTRHGIGQGASSANHGRMHCGTNTWGIALDDPLHEQITLPRVRAAKLLRTIPGVFEFVDLGLHLIAEPQDVGRFEAFCRTFGIPIERAGLTRDDRCWIDEASAPAIFEVPEFAFNPAKLAGRLAALAVRLGATVKTNRPVTRIEREGRHWLVTTSCGKPYKADVVFNAMGAWAGQVIPGEVSFTGGSAEDYRFDCWPLLELNCDSSRFKPLTRTLTVLDPDEVKPTAIPHGRCVILGANVGTVEIDHPDDPQGMDRRAFRPNQPMERAILERCRPWLKPLRHVEEHKLATSLETFFGTLRRPRGCTTGGAAWHGVFSVKQSQGYYELSGGIATTAIVDTLQAAALSLGLTEDQQADLMDRLPSIIRSREHSRCARMAWENPSPARISEERRRARAAQTVLGSGPRPSPC